MVFSTTREKKKGRKEGTGCSRGWLQQKSGKKRKIQYIINFYVKRGRFNLDRKFGQSIWTEDPSPFKTEQKGVAAESKLLVSVRKIVFSTSLFLHFRQISRLLEIKMDGVSDHKMSSHEVLGLKRSGSGFSDDESTESGYEGETLPQVDPSVVYAEEMRKNLVRMSRVKIENILRNRDGKICLSVETLRSYETFNIYACVRAHLIDENWDPKGWVLLFEDTDECTVIGAVQNAIRSWGIADKILTLTFQGYHHDPETFDEIKSCVESHKQLELDGKLFYVHCCAYLFKKMANDAYGAIDGIIDKLKRFISFPSVDQFWNVINFKLKDALDLKSMGELNNRLSDAKWKKVEQVHELVDKVLTAAKLIFERKYATGSNFLIGLNDLREGLKTAALSPSRFMNTVAQMMLQRLDEYWNEVFLALAIAAVMDPRCKMVYIDFLSSKSETPQQPTVLETVRSLYDTYTTTNTANVGQATAANTANVGQATAANTVNVGQANSGTESNEVEDIGFEEYEYNNTNVNPLSSHFQEFQEFAHTTIQAPPKSDLDLYLEEPVVSWDDNFDLLAWWRTQGPKYPTLSKMARDILSIQFSVLKSSDVYYNEEKSVDEKLLATGPELTNALLCTRSWFQAEVKK